jgi:two-component system, LytTR family, response regulator
MPRALLIDDEPTARDDLRRLLAAHADIAIVGEAGRLAPAGELLRTADYDLLLLDVELRGGTGFDLLPHVRPEARIIFVTAHSHYAVRAFEVNAVDYLVKPIAAPRLAAALRRVAVSTAGATEPDRTAPGSPPSLSPAPSVLQPDDLIHLKIGNGTTRFVALADIAAIESEENYSEAHLAGGTRLLVRRTLKAWEDALPATHFVRVHRTTIINLARYRGSDRQTGQTTLLHLDGLTEPVRASFRYLPDLRARLGALGREL